MELVSTEKSGTSFILNARKLYIRQWATSHIIVEHMLFTYASRVYTNQTDSFTFTFTLIMSGRCKCLVDVKAIF
jgi:hypothetical protein